MAGAALNDIKSRIKSVSGTMQITKAMELVATSKLRLAKEHSQQATRYGEVLEEAMKWVASSAEFSSSKWATAGEGRRLLIVIAGDRGLAGGFNSNVFKLAKAKDPGLEDLYIPVGKKAQDYLCRRGAEIFDDSLALTADVTVGSCICLQEKITRAYTEGRISEVILIWTEFVSMLTQNAEARRILPLECPTESSESFEPIFEGDAEEILDEIVPDYVGGRIYSATRESYASELAARRGAMNSANKNAEEMIGSLMLKFNRARQAVITQEITEIVSGAEALG